MRRQDRPRNRRTALRRLRIGLDDRREIRSGIAEQIVDASIGQQGEVGPATLRDAVLSGAPLIPRPAFPDKILF